MRLSDIMGQMGLWGWAVAAMVLFLGVYAGQVWSVFSARNRELMARAGNLPLADDLTVPPAAGATSTRDTTETRGTTEIAEVRR